jgi:hypothetical protein
MAEKLLSTIKKEQQAQVPLGTDLSGQTVTLNNGTNYKLQGASSGAVVPQVPAATNTVPPKVTPPQVVAPVIKTPVTPITTPPPVNPVPPKISAVGAQYNDGETRDAAGNIIYSSGYNTVGGKFDEKTGALNPNYTPKDDREDVFNTPGLTPEMRQKWLSNFYKGQGMGFTPGNTPGSFEDKSNIFFKDQKDVKDELDRQVDSQVAQNNRILSANSSAVDNMLAPNREGVVSLGNAQAGTDIKNELYSTTSRMIDSLKSQQSQLARLQRDQENQFLQSRGDQIAEMQNSIAKAQAELAQQQGADFKNTLDLVNAFKDNPALAYLSPDQRAALQQQLPQFPGLVNALSQNAQTSYVDKNIQTKFDNQTKAITSLKEMVGMGVDITPSLAKSFSQSTGLPVDAIMNFSETAKSTAQSRQLDDAQKLANLGKSEFELDQLHAGITNESLEKVQYLNNLYKEGRYDEAARAKKVMGISDEDDPMYMANLTKANLEGQALAIGLQYLPQEKQADLLNKITDANTKQVLLQYLPSEKQLGIALQTADLDYKGIINKYLPGEKQVTVDKIVQDIAKGDIELAWLPQEKQAAVGKAVLEMAGLAIDNQYKGQEKQQGLDKGMLDIQTLQKGLKMTDYDLIIKAAEAAGAPQKVVAELNKLKAEAKKAQLDVSELTGESILPDGYRLGSVASKYESGGDYSRISSGVGDPGGKSYGKYQFASNMGSLKNFINESGYADEFADTIVGKSAFDKKWKELATTPAFQKAQDDYIERHYFAPFKEKMIKAFPGLAGRGAAVDEMFWSTSVQYGPNNSQVRQALAGKDLANMTDAQIIEAVQDKKLANVGAIAPGVRNGVKNRIVAEKNDLLNLDKNIVKGVKKDKPVDETLVANLRKEINDQPAVADMYEMDKKYDALIETKKKLDTGKISRAAASDQMIRLFNQMITDRTILRQSDYANTTAGQSALEKVDSFITQWTKGGTLGDEEMKYVLNSADTFHNVAKNKFLDSTKYAISEADRLKIPRERVLGANTDLYGRLSGEQKTKETDTASNNFLTNIINMAKKAAAAESPTAQTEKVNKYFDIPEDTEALGTSDDTYYTPNLDEGGSSGNIFETFNE